MSKLLGHAGTNNETPGNSGLEAWKLVLDVALDSPPSYCSCQTDKRIGLGDLKSN